MERREFRFAPSLDLTSIELNTRPDPKNTNPLLALRSLTHLPLAFNTGEQHLPAPIAAENVLGEERYRAGLEGAFNSRGSPWP
jgi:hypothetical protein